MKPEPPPLRTAVVQPSGRRAPRVAGVLFSVLLGVLCYGLAFFPLGQQANVDTRGLPTYLAFAQLVLMLPMCVLLGWRARIPYLVTALGAGIAIAFPATPLPALIGMSVLLRVRRGPWVWALSAAVALGTAVSVIWDLQTAPAGMSLTALVMYGDDWIGPVPWAAAGWWIPLWTAVLVAPFALTGILRRLRAERNTAVSERHAAVHDADALHGEVSRHLERQEIARELHDTLASRLSSLSLNAGALELAAGTADPELTRAAGAVRATAQLSLDDLRHVVDVLRTPGAARLHGRTTLSEIDELIDEAQEAGDRVRSRLFVADASGCDPVVAHAAYRIVQESLSNARRHAPGEDVRVRVQGGPGSGLTLEIVNRVTGAVLDPSMHDPSVHGGGHGLTGMRERAENLGGTFAAGTGEDSTFSVTAWIPWVAPSPSVASATSSSA